MVKTSISILVLHNYRRDKKWAYQLE
jgi:hypothetical protein